MNNPTKSAATDVSLSEETEMSLFRDSLEMLSEQTEANMNSKLDDVKVELFAKLATFNNEILSCKSPIAGDNGILNLCNNNQSESNVGHLNVQSLKPSSRSTKLDEFRNLVYGSGMGVIGFLRHEQSSEVKLLEFVNRCLLRLWELVMSLSWLEWFFESTDELSSISEMSAAYRRWKD
ncbi:hypothetical protein EVAR_69880_1 [Eumeta japonica]|uniref:Uncharacterized protein n=1 Tax=Eumeta variegata TaxID=151549 RepID=A0A4C1SM31_EUMVA|nr:hypothetical protein EVAR_69880_1 [Eumeta japonica]